MQAFGDDWSSDFGGGFFNTDGGGGWGNPGPFGGGENDDDSSVTVTAPIAGPIDTITSTFDGLVVDDSDDPNSVTVTADGWDPISTIATSGDLMIPYQGPGSTGTPALTFTSAPVTSISNTAPASSAGASAGTYKPPSPKTPNAGTIYGDDPSPSNNYGLGGSAPSNTTLMQAETATAARPSLWWLLAALALIWMVA